VWGRFGVWFRVLFGGLWGSGEGRSNDVNLQPQKGEFDLYAVVRDLVVE
ncbi:hypothetical protein IQ269_08430, partial [Tychonema sp. LEGE 07199]|nr:hypothetical protein [Tychonema sp. LEGE 07199]